MAGASIFALASAAWAADEADADAAAASSKGDEIVVTGARGQPRSVTESAVPIDVFSSEELETVSYTDANDIIQTLVPSYTLSRQPISDGATFIRPASLRGLPTDKTLVLVNSKRRHRAALVSIGGSGTQGPDISTIPAIALKNVEVLRDGAAAQYGSDAIAGVINFILKDSNEGLTLTSQVGQFYEGDGFEYILSGNVGLPVGENGFINLSLEYSNADRTIRSEQYCESWWCVDTEAAADPVYAAGVAAEFGDEVVQRWGRPETDAFRSFVNFGYTFSDALEFYGFGNYSQSSSSGDFFYRYNGNGTIEDLRLPDGSIYSPLSIFPGGFTPVFSGDVIDYSIVAGFRGALWEGFDYDLSTRFGRDEIQYDITHTINPSLGPDTPTSFHPGDLINDELQVQADFTQLADLGFAKPVSIAFGGSYFKESYELVEGEPLSYEAGPYGLPDPWDFCDDSGMPTAAGSTVAGLDCSNPDDPVYTVVGVGSNGFPGYSPQFSGKYKRDSYAFYIDVSADITDKLFLEGAGRFENYSDFDSQLIYKFAGRYALTDGFAIRASYGTGFRAPTPGQQGTTNVSTRLPNGFPVATGLFPASSVVAQALGATPLKPEKSKNLTAGVTATYGGVNLSIDFYKIDLTDRVNAISTISVVDDCDTSTAVIDTGCLGYRGNLISAGVVGAESIGGVFYFKNAFDTTTKGVDIVATYSTDWAAGSTSFTAAVNYNETKFDGAVDSLFNAEDQYDFVNADPNWRGVFTVAHSMGDFDFTVRANYYGGYSNSDGSSTVSVVQDFKPEIFFDLEAGYSFLDHYKIALGARNIFDNYPAPGMIGESCCGRIYRSDSIVDWQGGYYYAKVTASF